MALAGIVGKGSPELVRFWGDSPLVREPDTVIYGLERLDPPEQVFLTSSPMRHVFAADIQAKGASQAARDALGLLHADAREFMVHFDADAIAQEEFPAVNVPGSGGLSFADVQASLAEFARNKNLLAFDVAQYNPDKGPDGSCAKKLIDLLAEVLAARFAALATPAAPMVVAPAATAPVEPASVEPAPAEAAPVEQASAEPAAPAAAADPITPEPSSSGDSAEPAEPGTSSSTTS